MLSLLQATFRDPLLVAAWSRFRRLWQPMAAWSLLLWAMTVVALLPFSSALVSWRLGRSETLVVGNEELLSWLLTPGGALTVLIAAAVVSLNWILRYAGVFSVITDDLEGRAPSFATSAWQLARKLPALSRFAIKAVVLLTLVLVPLAVGLWIIQRALLSTHDINYYLSIRPREWYASITLAVLWIAFVSVTAAYLLERIVLALPSWLDGYRGFTLALSRSWSLTRGHSGRLLRVLALVAVAWILGRAVVNATVVLLAAAILSGIGAATDALWPLVASTGLFLLSSILLDLTIDFVGFSLLATVLTTFYYRETGLHRDAPNPPSHPVLPPLALRWVHRSLNHPRGITLVAILAVVLSAFIGYRLLERLPSVRPIIITAHRAGPPPAPENTLAALEAAIAARADFAEIDVQRTRDGTVVVAHDADLMRMAGDRRRIAQHNYASLQSVVQLPDDASPPAERRLATLREFLARAQGRIRLKIELKYYGWDPLLVEAVVTDVRALEMEDAVVLISLNLDAVQQARRIAPDISVGYVSTVAVGSVHRLPVDVIALHSRRVTPATVREAQRRNQQVHAWTVNRASQMADLMEMGVHGLITDDPALAVRVRSELNAMTSPERLLLRFRKLLLRDEEN